MSSSDDTNYVWVCFEPEKETTLCKDDFYRPDAEINTWRKWSELPYAGESKAPYGYDPSAGSWPLFFLRRNERDQFTTPCGRIIDFQIKDPRYINFDKEQLIVKRTLKNLTSEQRIVAEYWGDGPATKQWTPIIDRLIDTYNLTPAYAARVLAAVQGGINDAFVVTWYFKYLWDVARPNQLDQRLVTAICTPKFPSYPSGHSVMSGTAETILSYFFPPEAKRLRELAEEDSISRVFGGVHFPSDISEGLRLGRHIGSIIVGLLSNQYDEEGSSIDILITRDRHADLPPPPYKQSIPYAPRYNDCDLPLIPRDHQLRRLREEYM